MTFAAAVLTEKDFALCEIIRLDNARTMMTQ